MSKSGLDNYVDAEADVPSALAELDAQVARSLRGDETEESNRVPGGEGGRGAVHADQASRLRALLSEASEEPGSRASLRDATPELEAATRSRRAFTIAVASGKGGVGKTNLTVNLAVALAALGKRVVVLDADLGTANVDVLCGVSPSARLDHVLGPDGRGWFDGGRRGLRDIAVEAPGGFRLIPGSAGISRVADLTAPERRRLLESLVQLDDEADAVLIDTGAGIGQRVTAFMDAADACVVVATPEPTSMADAYALIKCSSATEARAARWSSGADREGEFRLVMNQVMDVAEAKRSHARVRAVCRRFLGVDVTLLGWIAQDVRVGEAVRARMPLVLRSPGSEAARNISAIAATLAQEIVSDSELAPVCSPRAGVASMLRRMLGLS